MRTPLLAAALTLSAALFCGCDAPAPPRRAMSTIWLTGADRDRAFDTTRAVLKEFDFRIDDANPDAGYIRTLPAEHTVRGGTGRIGELVLQSPNRVRRVAEAYLRAKPGGVQLRLAVNRQRLDTASHRAYAREHADVDAPIDTPIDRETGSSPQQYETWSPAGRDRQLEAAIRDAIRERLTKGQ